MPIKLNVSSPLNASSIVTDADILAAAERLRGYTYHTPMQHARSLDAEAGLTTWFKTLCPEERVRGVITCSSDNHVLALALCAGIDYPYLLYQWASGNYIDVVMSYGVDGQMRYLCGAIAATVASVQQSGRPGTTLPAWIILDFCASFSVPMRYGYPDWRDPLPDIDSDSPLGSQSAETPDICVFYRENVCVIKRTTGV